MAEIGEKVVKRLQALESLRNPIVDVWRKCFKYTYPIRASGFYGETIDANEGLSKQSELTDSTTTDAARTLASEVMDGMTPANSLWFLLDVGNESDDEKRWLYNAAKFIWQNIHSSNYDSEAFEGVLDAICAGWFVLYIDEAEGGGYDFQLWPISECFIASTKKHGRVDTIYRKYKYTAEQAVSEFGEGNVSADILKCVKDGKGDETFEFIHAVYPRQLSAVNARLSKNLPFVSVHTEVKSKKVARESGYHEFPCVCPRWHKLPGSSYAVGPVYEALPDAATVNEIRRYGLLNLDMAIGGLWIAEDDGVLNPRNIKIGPRRVIIANSVDSMKPLQSSADFNVQFASEERIQAQIRRILMADILPPMEGQPRTAAEIYARLAHIRKLLGPMFGRLQSEYLQPMIERCFGIAYRAGVLGKPPESLSGRAFSVKYISPLARSQKLEEVNAIDQYISGAAMVAEIDPSVMDNVNLDAAMRFRGEALGVPTEVIPDEDAVALKRQQRQEQQQAQMQQVAAMEVQQEAGKAAVNKVIGGK